MAEWAGYLGIIHVESHNAQYPLLKITLELKQAELVLRLSRLPRTTKQANQNNNKKQRGV